MAEEELMRPGWDIAGKVALITGATDGIGRETAHQLARLGAQVLVHGRSAERARQVVSELRQLSPVGEERRRQEVVLADFTSLDEVRRLAQEVHRKAERLEVLIHNAGVIQPERQLTRDGYECTWQVNHLAPFLLTGLLLDLLRSAPAARVIVVSSTAHQGARIDFEDLQGERRYDPYGAYARSKLANLLFTRELAHRLDGSEVTANCLHPGVIGTKLLWQGFPQLRGGSLAEGADTVAWLACAPELAGVSGRYFQKREERQPSTEARDATTARRLWALSEEQTGIRY